jgi:hypothetical protein
MGAAVLAGDLLTMILNQRFKKNFCICVLAPFWLILLLKKFLLNHFFIVVTLCCGLFFFVCPKKNQKRAPQIEYSPIWGSSYVHQLCYCNINIYNAAVV